MPLLRNARKRSTIVHYVRRRRRFRSQPRPLLGFGYRDRERYPRDRMPVSGPRYTHADAPKAAPVHDRDETSGTLAGSSLAWLSRTGQQSWRGVLEGVVYLAAALVAIWPVTLHLTTEIAGVGDGEFYTWLGWRMAEQIKDGSLPLVISGATYPEGYHVAWGDGFGAYLVIALWNLVANPYFAVNLTVLTALLLNFLSARRLARIVAPGRRLVWIVAA